VSGHPDDRWNAVLTWLDEPLRGATSGLLEGRTLLVKDLIDTAGVRTTYGSRIYADHVPARSATVVDRVLAAGAVVAVSSVDTSSPPQAAASRATAARNGKAIRRRVGLSFTCSPW